jgi:hypothetical protein
MFSKNFIICLISILLTVGNANAVDLKEKLNKKIDKIKSEKINEIDEYVSNLVGQAFGNESIQELIPGQGLTEVSIQLRENYKPDFSILAVRELYRNNNENTFFQVSLL